MVEGVVVVVDGVVFVVLFWSVVEGVVPVTLPVVPAGVCDVLLDPLFMSVVLPVVPLWVLAAPDVVVDWSGVVAEVLPVFEEGLV